ncbi:PadR family transcriptional regulator [Nocardia altamirensis]|uniref:PadR family transcriptional regulator n=1 Tax=Nocardia altamirensis TaxID=472158 RepID=UPI0008405155|nr:PadR family transcriptional regulator [Nocardia altamirensis]
MTQRDPLRNLLAVTVLGYLLERPMHPYELGKLLKQRNAGLSFDYKHASLYMVVEQLSRAGYIEPDRVERDGQRPERTVYRYTASGRARLLDRMRELVSVPATEHRQFEAALALIVTLPPQEIPELLEQRKQALTEQAERQRKSLRNNEVDPLFLIEYDYRLELIQAELRFIERFSELVRKEPAALGDFWQSLHARWGPAAT